MVDAVTYYFSGEDILTRGDLGVARSGGRPLTTQKAEQAIAHFFQTEDAMLVRGAGTMAIRSALYSVCRPGDSILVHDAPVYPTTLSTFEMMGS